MPGSSPHLPFLFPPNRLKTITSMATDWITWDHRKDIHPDKTALLVWCQGFETRLIPCLINETHVGDSPLSHSCGQFSTFSLSVSRTPSPPQKLKQPGRGYLQLVKTLFEDIYPACVKVKQWKLQGPEHGIQRTERERLRSYFCVEGILCWTCFFSRMSLLWLHKDDLAENSSWPPLRS